MRGGSCINIACVPTKDLVVSAEWRRPDDDPAAWFADSVAGSDRLVAKLNVANHAMLADRENVALLDGTARFVGEREVAVATADGEVRVCAEHVVVDTGTPSAAPSRTAPSCGTRSSTAARPNRTRLRGNT